MCTHTQIAGRAERRNLAKKLITTVDPTSSKVELQLMHELMFQAGVKGMSERSELIPCNNYYVCV